MAVSHTHPFDTLPVEPRRDNLGRYLIVPPGGGKPKPYTRATTWAETIDDRHNLEKWSQRMVAIGTTLRRDLHLQVAATPVDDRRALDRICQDLKEAAAASTRANIGTALHRFTERLDRGEQVSAPEPYNFDLAAYVAAKRQAGLDVAPEHIERTVVVEALGVAGTFDRLGRLPHHPLPMVTDLKTGATLDFSWGAIAQQLALYAHAETIYDHATETHEPMPPVDLEQALVIHLPAEQAACTLYMVDIAAGWEAVQVSGAVRDYRRRARTLAAPYVEAKPAAVDYPTEAMVAWLRPRIIRLPEAARNDLAAQWPAGAPTLRQGGLTPAQLDAVADLLDRVEARHAVEFPEGRDPRLPNEPPPAATTSDRFADQPAPPPPPPGPMPDEAAVAKLRAAFDLLPSDLMAEVDAGAKTVGIANLRSPKATVDDLAKARAWLADAEVKHTERLATVVLPHVAAACQGDPARTEALCLFVTGGVHSEPDRFTEAHTDRLGQVVGALTEGWLRWDGTALVCGPALEGAITQSHGGARQALAAARTIANDLGRQVPRSLTALAQDPLLGPLTAAAPAVAS